MAKPPMRNRNIKVGDELWAAAMTKAAERGESVPDVIRAALEAYVKAAEKSPS